MTGCTKCGEAACEAQEWLDTIRRAAAQDFQACESDTDFAGLYVMSCRLHGSEHLTPEQAAERLDLHYKIKVAREKRFPRED